MDVLIIVLSCQKELLELMQQGMRYTLTEKTSALQMLAEVTLGRK